MKIQSPLKQLALATVAGVSLATLMMPHSCLANSTADPLQNLTPQDNNPLAPRSDEMSNMGVFDLINRLQRGTINWNASEQNQQLDSEAEKFRASQTRKLQGIQLQPNQQIQVAPLPVITR